MKTFLRGSPGAIWAAIITGLLLLAAWAAQYFGGTTWVVAAAALLVTVIVPVLRVLAQGEDPSGREFAPQQRSRFSRWLW
jgi:uncharacterized membrane protein